MHVLAGYAHEALVQIDLDAAEAQRWAFRHCRGGRTPERRANPRQKFADAERLRDVIVRAEVQSGDFVVLLPARRKTTIGVWLPSRTWRMTSSPSWSGRPRSRRIRSGRLAFTC